MDPSKQIIRRLVSHYCFPAKLIATLCCLGFAHAQGQYSQAIQQQMNAAGAQQSSATNPTYATPLATFQAFFNATQTVNMASFCATFTANGLSSVFDPPSPSSPSDYASLSTAMAANNPHTASGTSYSGTISDQQAALGISASRSRSWS